jgi:hypothetical protein
MSQTHKSFSHSAVCTGVDVINTVCEAAIVAAQQCTVLVGSVEARLGDSLATFDGIPQLASLRLG